MLQLSPVKGIFAHAIAGAVIYSIAASIYIMNTAFGASWVLYVGNFLFAAMIGFFIGWYQRHRLKKTNVIQLIVAGGKTAVAGIAISCFICFLLLLILKPGVFSSFSNWLPLKHAPAQFSGKNHGLVLILFMSAILGNAGAAFFIALLLPFSIVRTKEG